jgi:selenocysteine-specific elongation factor
MKSSIIIGTAGHIDHGKTALVKALTGVDTDRLPEEKARGITIDIGFAHTNWNGQSISFIDVPGHERFVKNMLAGIGGIHLLMLIVAADESIMPQTREHFDICRLLQIRHGVIVITKKDLVDDDTIAVVQEEIRDMVEDSFLQQAPVFAVSAKTGQGLQELKRGIVDTIAHITPAATGETFRLPVDRVFVLKGHGTVVTGTLLSGTIRKESVADLLPSGKRARVRSVHAHDESVEEAVGGQRTALNLQGVEKEEIQRGDVLVSPGIFRSTSLLDTKITLLSHARPLQHNAIVRFHHLTNDVAARITLLGTERLEPGETGYAQLRLQHPIHALYGDRFILRKHSPLTTVGGGVILDHLPLRRISSGDANAIDRMKLLETAGLEQRFSFAVQSKKLAGADEPFLQAKLGMPGAQVKRLQSPDVTQLRGEPLLAIHPDYEKEMNRKIVQAVHFFHDQNPLQFGISKEELRSKFVKTTSAEVFAAILERGIQQKQLQIQKDLIALFGRKVSLDQKQEELAGKIEQLLQQSGLGTAGLEDLSKRLQETAEKTRGILYLLVRQGKAVKIDDDYFLHKAAWEELKTKIRNLKSSRKTFSVPDFKALFGITRKFAIPLLENLDREGVTRRAGNERIIL